MARRYASDIPLEPPTVRHADVVPAVEDRSYLGYIASALAIAVLGGFVLAVVLPLIVTGVLPGEDHVPQLTQAHGWAQLQGWAGLFVAGMAMRLIPRFAGRPPLARRITMPILVLLVFSVVVRTIVQPGPSGEFGDDLLVAAAISGALGIAAVACVLAVTLALGRKRREAWRYFAWAGTAWWFTWAALTVPAAVRAAGHDRFTPFSLDDALTWIVMLGAIANFVWTVQGRSVPVFFGRRPLTVNRAVVPGVALNMGVLLIALSLFDLSDAASSRLEGAGFVLAGIGIAWLAPVAGAVYGTAHRLRPRARRASSFVLAANITTLAGGVFLAWAGALTLASGEFESFGLRDAARHAFGLGMITMLIVGMAQLVAPIFALERAEARDARFSERAPLWLLVAAAALRIFAGLFSAQLGTDGRMHVAATAGVLAWLGLVLFAFTVLRAILAETKNKALLGIPPKT